jgi:hypothetical protein
MIKISESLQQKAINTVKQMNANSLPVADIQDAEGLVLIRSGCEYACPPNSIFKTKMEFDGEQYWICEGSANKLFKPRTGTHASSTG